MKTAAILLFIVISSANSVFAQRGFHNSISPSNPLTSALDKRVDVAVREYMTRVGAVGLTVGILDNGKTISYGYGERGKGSKQ